jgi:tetratricopeptide (TPR) repeat protein
MVKGMMRLIPFRTVTALLPVIIFAGCVKLAFNLGPSIIPNMSQAFFEECDPVLARQSLPSQLKLMEGLLKNDPENDQILTALCMGFTGYALLFIEEREPSRASELYLRARDYGFKAMGKNASLLRDPSTKKDKIRKILNKMGKRDLEALCWTTLSWNSWINLNLDKPAVLGELGVTEACLERIMEIDPEYFFGIPYILRGAFLAARPKILGGDTSQAKASFEKAMALSNRQFFLAHYYFAKYYAVRTQDKELFLQLIEEVKNGSPEGLKEVCLINTVMKQKTIGLLDIKDELFF